MKRVRLIVQEIVITKQGEVKNFQIKLPNNVSRIIAIETDARIDTNMRPDPGTGTGGTKDPPVGDGTGTTTPTTPVKPATGGGGTTEPVREPDPVK